MPSAVAIHSIERVALRLHRKLPELVWDTSMLEGNLSTYPEVQTFLDGVTGGGRTAFDQEQALNLARSSKPLNAGQGWKVLLRRREMHRQPEPALSVVIAAAVFLLAGNLYAAIAFDVVESKDRRVTNQAVDVGNLYSRVDKHVALTGNDWLAV